MKFLLKPIQVIYSIYGLVTFILLMLVTLPFVVVASFFGKINGGNFIYKICKVWGYVWYFLIGMRHKNIYEVPHDTSRNYIFVANHISYMDIPPIVVCMNQPVRVLGKSEIAKYPVFGYIYKYAAILVERSNSENRAKSVRQLKAVLRKHISIFIFPEGTFNMTGEPLKDFYDGAFRIAIETQTTIKPILFVDSLKRLHFKSVFSLTPGRCRVVYMNEVKVDGLQMKDLPELKNKVHALMEAGLARYQ